MLSGRQAGERSGRAAGPRGALPPAPFCVCKVEGSGCVTTMPCLSPPLDTGKSSHVSQAEPSPSPPVPPCTPCHGCYQQLSPHLPCLPWDDPGCWGLPRATGNVTPGWNVPTAVTDTPCPGVPAQGSAQRCGLGASAALLPARRRRAPGINMFTDRLLLCWPGFLRK